MELSFEKSTALSKRSKIFRFRSFNIGKSRHSIGKPRIEEPKDLKRKRRSLFGSGGPFVVEVKKKRSRREVSLSSLNRSNKSDLSNSRSKLNGLNLGGKKKENSSNTSEPLLNLTSFRESSTGQKTECGTAIGSSNAENGNGLDSNIVVPKRPRGIFKRKKRERSVGGKSVASNSNCKTENTEDAQKTNSFEFEEVGSTVQHPDSSLNSENRDFLRPNEKKAKSRKRHRLVLECRTNVDNEACLSEDNEKDCEEFVDDDDGENLEQNAARMLSLRFDPRCIGFSEDSTAPQKPEEGSGLLPFRKKFDEKSRVLRPRKQGGKSFARKRRHFYEVFSSDVDPYWMVKQRIRVFWPLDKSWYFGVVKEYDPITKKHHIKYDDREEEWINLQNERFKLLLFPSEMSSKYDYGKPVLTMKQETGSCDRNAVDDSCEERIMESVPIMSWLARIRNPMRSTAPSTDKKKQKSRLVNDPETKTMSVRKNRKAASRSSVISTLSSTNNTVPTIAFDDKETQVSLLVRKDCSKNRKVSIVYFRKRFRKKGLALDELRQKELHICVMQVEPNKLTLELRILLKGIYYSAFRTEDVWLSRQNFLSYYGKLVLIWPAVRMEIAFVDKSLGLRKFSFEGCFKGAVSLLCFVVKTFCLREECCKLLEIEMPSTSIAIKVSNLHDQRMQFFSFQCYYWEMESSKQRLLENNFKQYCFLFSEPAISNFRDGNIENLSNRKDHASVLEDSVSLTDALSVSNDVDCVHSFDKPSQTDQRKNEDERTVIILEKNGSPGQPEAGHNDCMNVGNIETDNLHSRVEEELNGMESQISQSSSKVDQEKNNQTSYSSITRDSENIQHANQLSSASPRSVPYSKLWSENFIQNGFTSRKPRTRISYISPNLGHDIGSKHQIHQKKGRTYKKIRADKPDMECSSNVLVTLGDRGWRESGALVVLNSLNQKDWWILVKLSGSTKYVHKANQFLQPGIPNRFTHAMMWKGGNDWMLEFIDRSQWSLFKLMHEECYNRNLRAASVKNIPIPGVRLVDDFDESTVEKPFISASLKYHQEGGTEVDRALDPCNTLYDMDSDDEEWTKTFNSSCGNDDSIVAEIDLDIFERAMDMFEKVAYAKNSDQFTADELEEFMTELAPLDIITAIYEFWQQKRQKKGLPLIRQFQPALWEIYEQQLRDWEIGINKMKSSSDMHLEKACLLERPSMFAFCLRPRGLAVPNKGSKQRSQKRFMFAGHHSSSPRDHDSLNPFGKKSEELTLGGGKALLSVANHEVSFSPRWHKSSSCFSSKDSPRTGTLIFTKNTVSLPHKNSSIMPALYDGRAKRSGVRLSSSDGFQRERPDIGELRLRDAASAAQHLSNMAKLKREKAQWLFHKADLAHHKAAFALMIAEAIKASDKDVTGGG